MSPLREGGPLQATASRTTMFSVAVLMRRLRDMQTRSQVEGLHPCKDKEATERANWGRRIRRSQSDVSMLIQARDICGFLSFS